MLVRRKDWIEWAIKSSVMVQKRGMVMSCLQGWSGRRQFDTLVQSAVDSSGHDVLTTIPALKKAYGMAE